MRLYLLQNVSTAKYDVDFNSVDDTTKDCERPYVVQPVNSSNMILLVVSTICSKMYEDPMTVIPTEVIYDADSLACHKVAHSLPRRRPPSCIRNHTKEREIQDLCGGTSPAYRITLLPTLLPILLSIIHVHSALFFLSTPISRL